MTPTARSPHPLSEPEENLAGMIRMLRLAPPEREYRFCERRWRFDFAWPRQSLAVEVEGGSFVAGRHTRGAAFEADCEKYARAVLAGWRVLRVTPRQVDSGQAIEWLIAALERQAA